MSSSSDRHDFHPSSEQSPKSTSIYGETATLAKTTPDIPADSPSYVTPTTADTAVSQSVNWSTALQTVLDQPPSMLPQRLVLGGMVFCLAFSAWAWLGQIEKVGRAPGQLVPKGDVYKISPTEFGQVTKIFVKEGDVVQDGQVLVELDTKIATIDAKRLQQTLAADQAQLSRMQALIDRARLEAQTHTAISDADSHAQEAAITQSKINAATTQVLLAQLKVDTVASRARLAKLKPVAMISRDLLAQMGADAAANQTRLKRLRPLVNEGAVSREYLFEAEQAFRDRRSAIVKSQLEESIVTQERLFEVEQGLRNSQSEATKGQGELLQTLTESKRLQAELSQKQAEGRTAQLEAEQKVKQLEVDMTQLKANIAETQNLLDSAKAKLKQHYLTAPVNGVVFSLNIRNVGEVIQPGQIVTAVAPHNAPLVLSASLPNQEAGFVKKGMPVKVKIDAYPYQDYGIIPGKIVSISPSTRPDERLGEVYQVQVALEHNYVTAKQQTIKLKAGQTATAEIVTDRYRIADMLLDPFRQLQKGGIAL